MLAMLGHLYPADRREWTLGLGKFEPGVRRMLVATHPAEEAGLIGGESIA